jgi:hypothetical protein
MRQHYIIQLEKAKVQILLCREVLSYTEIPEELRDKMNRLLNSCISSEEYFSAKIEEIDESDT